ncbi:MAG TPA: aromatic ring-hydroxylating dioxygenase subunit alpha [Caulobacteraceae bacterium]
MWTLERTSIFARSWQFFGHESALADPGCWVARTIAGYRLFVLRDDEGSLRGFHDVCRHRAGPLTLGESGRCEGDIVCRYHGWRYAYDGRLKAARDFGPAADFDVREFGLFPVGVETWRGLVFVAMAGDQGPLAAWTAPLEARLAGAEWSDLGVALTRSHTLACNWKTYVENYLEGYHVPLVHPGLDAEIDSSRYAVRVEGRVALHDAPLRNAGAVYGGLWGWLWPNLGVNVYGRGLMLECISPQGAAMTRLDYIYLMPRDETVDAATLAMSDQVTAEDIEIVERVQENLDAGIYQAGRLSPRHEGALAAFQAMVRDALSRQSSADVAREGKFAQPPDRR